MPLSRLFALFVASLILSGCAVFDSVRAELPDDWLSGRDLAFERARLLAPPA